MSMKMISKEKLVLLLLWSLHLSRLLTSATKCSSNTNNNNIHPLLMQFLFILSPFFIYTYICMYIHLCVFWSWCQRILIFKTPTLKFHFIVTLRFVSFRFIVFAFALKVVVVAALSALTSAFCGVQSSIRCVACVHLPLAVQSRQRPRHKEKAPQRLSAVLLAVFVKVAGDCDDATLLLSVLWLLLVLYKIYKII